jgi:hypothetical protein
MKFIVVGTGRCGTGYVSKVLSKAGLPCGHETVYTIKGKVAPKRPLMGDSSWLAVPKLLDLPYESTKIVHIVRDPLKVFRSWLFDQNNVISLEPTSINSPYNKYIRTTYPDIDRQETQVDKAAIYYIQCNQNIVSYTKERRLETKLLRVEDNPSDIIEWLGGKTQVNFKKWTNYNSRNSGVAGDDDVLLLLKQSKYYEELVDAFSFYYPELYNKYDLLGGPCAF